MANDVPDHIKTYELEDIENGPAQHYWPLAAA